MSSYEGESDTDKESSVIKKVNNVQKKGSEIRRIFGLDSDDETSNASRADDKRSDLEKDDDSFLEAQSQSDDSTVDAIESDPNSRQAIFVPGENKLKDKIQAKLSKSSLENNTKLDQLSPFQQFLEKKKLKRREKRQEKRAKEKNIKEMRRIGNDHSSLQYMGSNANSNEIDVNGVKTSFSNQPTMHLELLVPDDEQERQDKDFDMRELQLLEKRKNKKLCRRHKTMDEIEQQTTQTDEFQVDMTDQRFAAVLDGRDNRFGIDPNHPNFKETPAMRDILKEQSRRRRAVLHDHQGGKRSKGQNPIQ
jgi:hypothetical protein